VKKYIVFQVYGASLSQPEGTTSNEFFLFFLRRPQATNILPALFTRNTQVIMVFAPLKKDRRL